MIASQQHAARVGELVVQRRTFVRATVVRAQCPTSARPGDAAIVLPDGSIEGFIGGQCAEESVRAAALDALESGESTLLRILPADAEAFPDTPGAITVVNPCLSGGAIEVFLEPNVPAARIAVVGNTPDRRRAGPLRCQPRVRDGVDRRLVGRRWRNGCVDRESRPGRGGDHSCGPRRRRELHRSGGERRARCRRGRVPRLERRRTPSREEPGRCSTSAPGPPRRSLCRSSPRSFVPCASTGSSLRRRSDAPDRPATAIDPVCGMTVTIVDETAHLAHDGADYWFCNPGCRLRYAEELGVGLNDVHDRTRAGRRKFQPARATEATARVSWADTARRIARSRCAPATSTN